MKRWSVVVLAALWTGGALAQGYPSRPVRLVVTYPPGGGADVIARTTGQKLTEVLGQPVVVENRAGANGNIGTEFVARSAPDGYTLVVGNTGPLCISPAIYANLPYRPAADFAPISLTASTPLIMVAHPSLPVTGVRDVVRLAKQKPAQLHFASSGSGATSHLAGEMLKLMAGIDMVHVPYKGVALAVTDLMAGQVQLQVVDVSVVRQHVNAGRLRAIAWAGAKRAPAYPDLPTVAESGFPGFDVSGWYGILAPAGTPRDIVDRLHGAIVKVVGMREVQERFEALGAVPVTSTPDEFAAYIRAELPKWAKVAQAARLKVD